MEHLSCSSNQQKGKQQIYTATITNNTRAFHISGWNVAPNAIPSHKQIYLKKFMQPFFASVHIFSRSLAMIVYLFVRFYFSTKNAFRT